MSVTRSIVTTYDYLDEGGALLYQNVRFEPKDFRQRRPDGNGGHVWNLNGTRRVVYNLPELIKSSRQDWTAICEGEKDVHTLAGLGFTATTSGGGDTWRPEFAKWFEGRLVAVFPHKDKTGERYAQTVAKSLYRVASEVRIVDLGGTSTGFDITDFCDQHDSLEPEALTARIVAMIDKAKPFTPDSARTSDVLPVTVCLDNVTAKPVQWLWWQRFPVSMLSLLVGDPGLGKTFVALDMAARISTGQPWPDNVIESNIAPIGKTILLTAEDALEYTIRPRLDKLGADPSQVIALKGVETEDGAEHFSVTRHIPALEEAIEIAGDVKLVVVDPISAYLGSVDSHKNAEVRTALALLSDLAEQYGVAVVGISHLNKSSSSRAIHRTIGSVAFNAAARAVWLVATDQDDDARRVLAPVKSNLAPNPTALGFRIVDGAVAWESEVCKVDVNDLLSDHKDESPIGAAVEFLQGVLADGRVRSTELLEMAKRERIAERTLRRAKAKLDIIAEREGIGSTAIWFWRFAE